MVPETAANFFSFSAQHKTAISASSGALVCPGVPSRTYHHHVPRTSYFARFNTSPQPRQLQLPKLVPMKNRELYLPIH